MLMEGTGKEKKGTENKASEGVRYGKSRLNNCMYAKLYNRCCVYRRDDRLTFNASLNFSLIYIV